MAFTYKMQFAFSGHMKEKESNKEGKKNLCGAIDDEVKIFQMTMKSPKLPKVWTGNQLKIKYNNLFMISSLLLCIMMAMRTT